MEKEIRKRSTRNHSNKRRSSPTKHDYIVQQPHSWCFRMGVPPDLKHLVGKTELRYTLHTGSRGEAKQKSKLISSKVKRVFKLLRRNGSMGMSKDAIKKLVDDLVKGCIAKMEDDKATSRKTLTPPEIHEQLDQLEMLEAEFKESLASNDYRPIYPSVDLLIESDQLPIVKDSDDYLRLAHHLLKAKLRKARELKREQKGKCEGRKSYLETDKGKQLISRIRQLRRKPRSEGKRRMF